jgi:ABC-type dipeptide/oligopeptide/nickel transport system permease component
VTTFKVGASNFCLPIIGLKMGRSPFYWDRKLKRYILRRLILGLLVIWVVSVIIFFATRIGGDPALLIAPPGAGQDELRDIRDRFGLNQPLIIQYVTFITRGFQGDFGESLYYGVPAFDLLIDRLPSSLELVITAQIFALTIGIFAGVLAAKKENGWVSNIVRWFSLLGLAMPNFWIGMLFILLFSVYLKILPTGGQGGIDHLLMPAFSLGWYFSAGYTRITYSSLLQVLGSEFIKLARVKGLPEALVIGKHALKNALIPVITLAGMNLVVMISSAVAIEIIFAWPGVGLLVYEGAVNRDFNVVQSAVIFISVLMVGVNLLVDVLYAYLDPRIRYR